MLTRLMLDGGHTITVHGTTPGEVQRYLTERREADDNEMAYFQSSDRDDNSIVVDPFRVVAAISVLPHSRRDQAPVAE